MGPHGAQVSVIGWRRLHMPRSLSRGVSEMHTRCAYCGGKFGLVRQQWFQTQFCSSAAERNFLPSSQRTETECVSGWVSQKPDDEIRCPNPLAYSRKKLMAVHALPAASALANSSREIDGRREPSLEARSTGTDCCRNALCVPKTRFCNIGDEVRRGQAVM